MKKFVEPLFETRQRQIITLGLVAEAMRRSGFLTHRCAEVEGDDEQKNKYPQHHEQGDPPLIGEILFWIHDQGHGHCASTVIMIGKIQRTSSPSALRNRMPTAR